MKKIYICKYANEKKWEIWKTDGEDNIECFETDKIYFLEFAVVEINEDSVDLLDFESFIEAGKKRTDNIVAGMPWSFDYNNLHITHETDQLYLLSVEGRPGTLHFKEGDTLITGNNTAIIIGYDGSFCHGC